MIEKVVSRSYLNGVKKHYNYIERLRLDKNKLY